MGKPLPHGALGIDGGVLNWRSGHKPRRQLNREISAVVILIAPSRDVADDLLDVIVAKLLNNRSGRMPLQLHLSREIR